MHCSPRRYFLSENLRRKRPHRTTACQDKHCPKPDMPILQSRLSAAGSQCLQKGSVPRCCLPPKSNDRFPPHKTDRPEEKLRPHRNASRSLPALPQNPQDRSVRFPYRPPVPHPRPSLPLQVGMHPLLLRLHPAHRYRLPFYSRLTCSYFLLVHLLSAYRCHPLPHPPSAYRCHFPFRFPSEYRCHFLSHPLPQKAWRSVLSLLPARTNLPLLSVLQRPEAPSAYPDNL